MECDEKYRQFCYLIYISSCRTQRDIRMKHTRRTSEHRQQTQMVSHRLIAYTSELVYGDGTHITQHYHIDSYRSTAIYGNTIR
jgi:hypothetical protein